MITRGLILLIRTVVFFIDYDQSQIGKGSKYGRASSDTNGTLTRCHTAAIVFPFALGQLTMHNRHLVGKTCRKATHNLSG